MRQGGRDDKRQCQYQRQHQGAKRSLRSQGSAVEVKLAMEMNGRVMLGRLVAQLHVL
jgi:hypothetical protein